MFIMSRKVGESILIESRDKNRRSVTITVVRIKPDGTVCLGIEAPPDWPIIREEFYRAPGDPDWKTES